MGRHTPRDDEDRVRSSLREHAESYQPDRAAISTRVAQGRAAEQQNKSLLRSLIGIRPIGAALAVVGVLVGGVTAVQASSADDDRNTAEPPPPAVVVPTTGSTGPAGSSAPSSASPRSPSAPATTPGGSNSPSGTPSSARPSTGAPSSNAVTSWLTVGAGLGKDSVPTWSENLVTLKTTSPIVALKITITVPAEGGAGYAGRYTNVSNSDVIIDHAQTDKGITYTFALRDGLTIPPGEYKFGAQFTHENGRPGAADGYTIEAGTKSASAERSGRFV